MAKSLGGLIMELKEIGVLKSPVVEAALAKIDRQDFVTEAYSEAAYEDTALPLYEGQTISQPSVVAFMLEKLDVKSGQIVLDIGAGSGWVSCLLGDLVGRNGRVYAYEINSVVGEFGQKNVEKYNMHWVEYIVANAADDWEKYETFDRIYSGAAFKTVPKELLRRLSNGGIMIIPMQDGYIRRFRRITESEFNEEAYEGFAFVPFIEG